MSNTLILVAVLACPVAMCTMMFFMMRGHNKKDESGSEHSDKDG